MSDETPKKPASPPRTRPCQRCGKDMPASRSVCPECGHTSTWFKLRVVVGCLSLGLGGLAILLSLALALWGPGVSE